MAKVEENWQRRKRDEQIREEFDGSNYTQLAVRYGLTETWIRTIVMEKARELRQKPIDGQISMFDL